MALQFDPGAYFAAYQGGQKNEEANDDRMLQLIQTLGQGVGSYQNNQRQMALQKQQGAMQQQTLDLQKQAAAREQAEFERKQNPQTIGQLSSSNRLSQPVSPLESLSSSEPSFNSPMLSMGSLDLMGQRPQAPTMQPQAPQAPQSNFVSQFREFQKRIPSARQAQSPQPQGPVNLESLLSGDVSNFTPETLKTLSEVKENLTPKRPELYSPDQLLATGLDSGTVDKLKVQYPNGIPKEVAGMASTNLNRTANLENRTSNQSFQNENQLQTKFLSESKDFKDTATSFQRIQDSAANPSAAGDLALIFNYMKMLDPGSTVREGEFANAQNAGSVPDKLQAQYNKIISGERLSQPMRDDFINRATSLYQGQESRHKAREDEFRRVAQSYNMNPDRVIVDLRSKGKGPSARVQEFRTVEEAESASLPPGTKIMIGGRSATVQ